MSVFVDRPKVVLHDHLDGGVRTDTVAELAERAGVALPVGSRRALSSWMSIAPSMTVAEAFARFDLVISVLQSADGLRRVAREAVEDLADDGVIHAELRFAPLAHTMGGLDGDAVLEAVLAGIEDASGNGTTATVVACGLNGVDPSAALATAELAARWSGRGVVGFDLAGAAVEIDLSEFGAAFARARAGGLGVTCHAGEMAGPESVAAALDVAAPDRIGHGWRLIDDCQVVDGRIVGVGPIAARVRDAGIVLEMCPTSNACLGLALTENPAHLLADAGFRVTLNPDDRSITTTTTSREHELAAQVLGFTTAELASANERAAAAAFLPEDVRAGLVERVRSGWPGRPSRLVHLAERSRWLDARSAGASYLPEGFETEGFVHLSALHQVLGPANALFRGRADVVALVLDAHLLGDAVVWEPGTGTQEWFPHLYGAVTPDSVLATVDLVPAADGSFLVPEQLRHLVG